MHSRVDLISDVYSFSTSVKARQNGLAADLLTSIDLTRFPMLHSRKKLEKRIIDLGYESTIKKIKDMRRK